VAIDLSLRISVETSKEFMVDGEPLNPRYHAYIKTAIEKFWTKDPVAFSIDSTIPRASGLGSSAAVTVATLRSLKALEGVDMSEEDLARGAFEIEYDTQGRASPTDTSVCSHGRAIMLTREAGEGLLWNIKRDDKSWFIHHIDIPDMTFVLGNTRIRGKTPFQVQKVKRYCERSGHARETIEDIGRISLEGSKALVKGDLSKVGELMALNHRRLSSLGVSHPKLEKLIKAVAPHSLGAKLTGAGGGGCIVALTEDPEKAAKAIKRAGGMPIIVSPAKKGARVVK